MEKVKFKYFVNGVETELEQIDWVNSTGFTRIDNEVHVEYPYEHGVPTTSDLILNDIKLNGSGDTNLSNVLSHLIKEFGLVPVEYTDVKSAESNEYTSCDSNIESVDQCCDSNYGCASNGVKHNSYKAPLDIVINRQFPKALQLVALATAFGNKKYQDTDLDFLNFKRVSGGSQTYFDAAARHNTARDYVDEDSLLPHVVHAVWNMLAALEIMAEEKEIDIEKVSKDYLEDLHMSK